MIPIHRTLARTKTNTTFEEFWNLVLEPQGLKHKDGEIVELSNVSENGKECKPANYAKSSKDLQELTEFEMALQATIIGFVLPKKKPSVEDVKYWAKELMNIAYKQFRQDQMNQEFATFTRQEFNEAVDEEIKRRCDAIDAKEMGKEYFRSLPGSDYYAPERLHNRTVEHREAYKQGIDMKARLFDERGEITFNPEDVEEITMEYGGYSLLIKWKNGECDRATYVGI